MFYLDPLYLLLFIVTLAISGGSQLYIKKTFAQWNARFDESDRLVPDLAAV